MVTVRRGFGLLLAASLCTACALVLGINDDRPLYPDTTDGGDAGAGGDAVAYDPCGASTAFPPRPPDGVGAPVLDLVVRHPGFQGLPSDSGAQVCAFGSMNLDGLDTCNGLAGAAGSACVPRAKPVCDLGEGRDDVLGGLISLLPEGHLDERIENGELGMMISISGYSGGADDGNVTIDLFALGPIEPKSLDAGPTWNGSDSWSIDKESCPQGNCSLFSLYRGEGYVAGGVLVVHVPAFFFPLTIAGGSRAAIPVEDAILTGILHPDGARMLTDGRVAGRVPREPALRAIGRANFFGKPFCESKSSWPFVLKVACEQADLPREAGATESTCDALSVGITFEGWRAVRGKPIGIDPGGDCPDAASFACP